MLLIEDDEPGVFHRGEQGRAGAYDDVCLAVPRREPGIQAFAVVDVGVEQGDAGIETLLEASQGLWSEVDFRDQHQRLLARLQHLVDELQVDLGLATPGDAGEQVRLKAIEAGANGFESGALLLVQR